MAGDIVKGSFSEKLPRPEGIVKVSRQQARVAREAGKVNAMASKAGGTATKYQRGAKAEQMILADLARGAKGKKVLVVADPFMAVGDRGEAVVNLLQEPSEDVMLFYFGSDPREHFQTIAKIRVLSKVKEDFQEERLSVSGFVPLPKVPPAWVGKMPDLASARAQLRQALSILTCRDDGSLVIPDDETVPVELNDELQAKLKLLREKFPAPKSKEAYPQGAGGEVKYDSMDDLLAQLTVWKTIRKAEYNLLVAGKGDAFDISQNAHGIWLENPSASAKVEIEADTFICGLQSCKFVQEASGNYDPQSPCSVKLSFGLNRFHMRSFTDVVRTKLMMFVCDRSAGLPLDLFGRCSSHVRSLC